MLKDSVTIAIQKDITNQKDALLVAIRQLSSFNVDRKVDILKRI